MILLSAAPQLYQHAKFSGIEADDSSCVEEVENAEVKENFPDDVVAKVDVMEDVQRRLWYICCDHECSVFRAVFLGFFQGEPPNIFAES